MTLFTAGGVLFLLRWTHLLAGITWIGLLYYFNFVQGSFFAETDGATKSNAIQKLVPRALWWFRWAAMYTMITGVLYIGAAQHVVGGYSTGGWIMILTGAAFGLTMWYNVWFIIWPNQKIVIQSATQAATGGQALPNAAAAGAVAGRASRTNVLLSGPMVFFMAGTSHLAPSVAAGANISALAGVIGVIWAIIEFNAFTGKVKPLVNWITPIKGVITSSAILTAVLYVLIEIMTK